MFHDPSGFPPDLAAMIGPHIAAKWNALGAERRALLQLLSRFDITSAQAKRWFLLEERAKAKITLSDRDILANPYLCFEADRKHSDAISIHVVDRAVFPSDGIAAAAPMPKLSACTEPIDPRRARALCVYCLELAASRGDTLLPQDWLVQRVQALDLVPKCNLSTDSFAAFEMYLEECLCKIHLRSGSPAWQLREFLVTRDVIEHRVGLALTATRHAEEHDWHALVEEQLPARHLPLNGEREAMAREEKVHALREMFQSQLSVLNGPAGSGKTSLLKALLSIPGLSERGVLLLAPTGKARVRMRQAATHQRAYTLAQFLRRYGRYDSDGRHYVVTGSPQRESSFRTVIIDECSMLTETQLAAAFDALDSAVVHRLVLVGDPHQLPPIGAGRPFVDIIRQMRSLALSDQYAPPGYAELTVIHRQTGATSGGANVAESSRDDLLLGRFFRGAATDPGLDAVWDRLETNTSKGIRAVRWDSYAELQTKLLARVEGVVRLLAKEADVSGANLESAFELSFGAAWNHGDITFSLGAAAQAESWQILTPFRANEAGVGGLNRWLQKRFRGRVRQLAGEKPWLRKVYEPLGPEGILYGDKVISCRNGLRKDVNPSKQDRYLANGEIGIVIGQYKANHQSKGLPDKSRSRILHSTWLQVWLSGTRFQRRGR